MVQLVQLTLTRRTPPKLRLPHWRGPGSRLWPVKAKGRRSSREWCLKGTKQLVEMGGVLLGDLDSVVFKAQKRFNNGG